MCGSMWRLGTTGVPHTDVGGEGLLDVAPPAAAGARMLPEATERLTGALSDATGEGLLEHGAVERALHVERVLKKPPRPALAGAATLPDALGSPATPLHRGELDLARTMLLALMTMGGTMLLERTGAPGMEAHLLREADADLADADRGDQFDEPVAAAHACTLACMYLASCIWPWWCEITSSTLIAREGAPAGDRAYCATWQAETERRMPLLVARPRMWQRSWSLLLLCHARCDIGGAGGQQ